MPRNRPIPSLLLALVALATIGAPTASAGYEDLTNQSLTVGADFLQEPGYLQTVKPVELGSACVVDTGATMGVLRPEQVLSREAVGGGDPNDQRQPTPHGTFVAQVLGAPMGPAGSNYAAGILPGAKLRIVRADVTTPGRFHDLDLVKALSICRSYPDVRVINLSLGGYLTTEPSIVEQIEGAINDDLSVVASAGNDPNLPISTIASLPGVISVASIDPFDKRCAISTTLAPTTLVALGCGVEVDNGAPGQRKLMEGTSAASPQVSAALLALRTFKAGVSARQAEQTLIQTADIVAGGVRVNLAAAFAREGIPTEALTAPELKTQLRRRGSKLIVRADNRPDNAQMLTMRGGQVINRSNGVVRLTVGDIRGLTFAYAYGDQRGKAVRLPKRIIGLASKAGKQAQRGKHAPSRVKS